MNHTGSPLLFVTLLLALTITLLGCNREKATELTPPTRVGQVTVIRVTPTPIPFDSDAVLATVADTIVLPWHQQLVDEAKALDEAITQLAAEPSGELLADAQSRWRSTAELWAKVELFDFQFTMVLHRQLNSWPTNVERVEEFIAANEEITDAFVSSKGSNVKGLPAMEYLLFDTGLPSSEQSTSDTPSSGAATTELLNELIVSHLIANPSRIAYLEGLGQTFVDGATALNDLWSVEGQNSREQFVSSTLENGGIEGTFDVLLTAMIFQLEMVERNKVGVPLRGTDAYAKPDSVESPYANHSMALVHQNVVGLNELMEAGLYQYLLTRQSHYDSQVLVTHVETQFNETLAALDEIQLPLAEAVVQDPAVVAAAWEEIKELSRRFEVDMANHVGLAVTIGQNDGD